MWEKIYMSTQIHQLSISYPNMATHMFAIVHLWGSWLNSSSRAVKKKKKKGTPVQVSEQDIFVLILTTI